MFDSEEFEKIIEEYDNAIERKIPAKEWLTFQDVFPKCGKQGVVGLAITKSGRKVVYKMSQYINFLTHHELTVMEDLRRISWCPHFCKPIGGVICDVNPICKKQGNPFSVENMSESNKHCIEKEVMLMECIDDGIKFSSYIKSKSGKDEVIYSTIKQVLLGISIAQKRCSFSHYDLHSNNVMLRRCDDDLSILYVIDENNQFLVPTFGYYPVIIDFGFAFSSALEGKPLYASLGHTEVGFMSDRFDKFADPKLFLITVSGEMTDYKDSKKTKEFSRCIKNMFSGLKIEWDCAWDKGVKCSASDYVRTMIRKLNKKTSSSSEEESSSSSEDDSSSDDEEDCKSSLFCKCDHYAVDLLQILITCPLKQRKHSSFDTAFSAFLDEWLKVEATISNPFYLLYILKGIVISAKTVEKDYTSNSDERRKHAVIYFSRHITSVIHSIAKFCNPKLNYEKLLCSLYCVARCMEGILYEAIKVRMDKKNKRYERLPLQTIDEMFVAIDVNFEDDYRFNSKSKVLVVDNVEQKSHLLSLSPSQAKELNEYEPLSRGGYVYDIYKSPNVVKEVSPIKDDCCYSEELPRQRERSKSSSKSSSSRSKPSSSRSKPSSSRSKPSSKSSSSKKSKLESGSDSE